ncbi:MAG: Sua5/YciO/YrdC/YwlC family protein [Planctomycetota bacterium]
MSSVAERVPIEDAPPPRDLCRRVEAALASGEVVCMPTETVYGFAARADLPEALANLRALKSRDAGEPLTWHVGRPDVIERFDRLVPLARRLAERYWPGPLTLVLEGLPRGVDGLEGIAPESWTGMRLPAHRGTAGVLEALPFPVVMTSANTSGDEPLLDADSIAEGFGPRLALLLDGGPSRLGEPSGVLRLGRGSFRLLREGLVSIGDLRRVAGLRIGFCCTGNTCRSPMAEGLAKLELGRRLGSEATPDGLAEFGFEVESFGVFAGAGAPPSEHAVEVLRGAGYDLSGHRSAPATLEGVTALDRVYCLTPAHLENLRALLPPGKAHHLELLDPDGDGIPDPIGGPLETYRMCAERIGDAIQRRAADWA